MTALFNPWWDWFKIPNIIQDINPVTSWWSPQFEFNFAGDRKIESKIVAEVASYGKQLGLLSEALLEVAAGEQGDAVAKLKEINQKVEQIKREHKSKLEEQLKRDLNYLNRKDPEALRRLLNEYQICE